MSGAATLFSRGSMLAMSAALVAWAILTLQGQWGMGPLGEAAARIMAGETLRPEATAAALQSASAAEHAARPSAILLHDAALLRVRAAEDEVTMGHPIAGNPAFAQAETTVRAALALAPTDGFLWFALAWLGKTRDGARAAQLPWLAWSYRTAPQEGWLALHRNTLAVALLPALPAPLQTAALAEFRGLVASNYTNAAADILTGPGWPQHDTLLATLASLSQDTRAAFAQTLAWRGVDVDVPGVARRRDRPWR